MSDAGGIGNPGKFGAVDFLVRLLFAIVLVTATYNPTDYSFSHWLRDAVASGSVSPLHALAGVVLLIGWTIFVRTTWASLGFLGVGLALVFFAVIVWTLVYYKVVAIGSMTALVWILLMCLAVLLALGMSWAHLQRRASGQVEVEQVER